MSSTFIHVVAFPYFFLRLKGIPLCVCCYIYLFINGHLDYFHLLAIMNNASMNMVVQICLQIPLKILLGKYKWDCWIIWWFYFLMFWGNFILFSTVVALFYNPINSAQVFQFLHILSNAYLFIYFNGRHPDERDIILWYWFASLWWLVMLSVFSYACWSFKYYLWRNVQMFWPFFNRVTWFFCCWIVGVLYIFLILIPYQVYDLLIFSLIPLVAFWFYWLYPLMHKRF